MENRIHFVSQGNFTLASHRLRVIKPCQLLNSFTDFECSFGTHTDEKATVNLYFKHFNKDYNYLAVCGGVDLGYKTVFDVCDDYFDREHSQYYRAMCEKVDAITCNSKAMQERVYEVTGRLARVVDDPVTFPKGHVESRTWIKPKILWFGNSQNIAALKPWLDIINQKVTCVSDIGIKHRNVDFIPWVYGVTEQEALKSNVVILPTQKTPHAKYKSMNRALDALNSGNVVITDSEEIYGEIKDFIHICKEPEEVLKVLADLGSDEQIEKIVNGQKFIRDNWNDHRIVNQWLDVFKDIGVKP